jgi:hypothetical protein
VRYIAILHRAYQARFNGIMTYYIVKEKHVACVEYFVQLLIQR